MIIKKLSTDQNSIKTLTTAIELKSDFLWYSIASHGQFLSFLVKGDRGWKGRICLNGWKIKIMSVFPWINLTVGGNRKAC